VRSLVLSVVLVAFAPACGGPSEPAKNAVPESARVVLLSLHGVDCAECASEVRAEVEKDGKVYDSSFDRKRVVLKLVVEPKLTDAALVAAAKRAGIDARPGDAGGSYLRDAEPPAGADVQVVVTDGRDFPDLNKALAAGKITVIDFYAEWCGPCRKVDEHVKKVLNDRKDVAYRRMNIVDWDTPLAQRYLKGAPELPYVLVYDGKGTRVDAIAGVDLARLDAAIAKAKP
jgi:thiol-disulfide isomerase/thioredoxin